MSKDNKTILVTGAASGIGLTVTEFLASKGYFVIATDINEKALSVFSNNQNVDTIVMDVSDTSSIKKALAKIEQITDGLDGLINSAGYFTGGPLVEISEQEMEKIIAVNVLGVFRVTKYLYPLIKKRKGRIINFGSECGRLAFPLNGPYSMTKYALEAFSDSLRREVMFHKVKVIHFQIGAIKTPFLERTYCCYTEDIDMETSQFKNILERIIPTCENEVKRAAKPISVAKKVHRVLRKRKPRARYRIKNNKLRRFLDFLPTSLLDFGIRKMLK